MVNKKLKQYIEQHVLPEYEKNDLGHNIKHIEFVIRRSLEFANNIENINLDMVYTIASYHDIGHHINAKTHEKISANILFEDEFLNQYFTKEQLIIMKEAVEDHRASLEYTPRSIYGKIVSSADRNTLISVILKRMYQYRLKHCPNLSNEEILEESRSHLQKRYGKKGYSRDKIYFKDKEYNDFLKEIDNVLSNKKLFEHLFKKENNF